MTNRIALRCADWRVEVAPGIGGSVLGLTLRGRAILRPTPDEAVAREEVRRTACYPLVPYANRIAFGRFRRDGRDYVLRGNFPGSAHPLHGVGWRRPWRVLRADEALCALRLEHRPRGDDALDWPFAFDAVETIAIGPKGLRISLEATNVEGFTVPLGLGLHPLFERTGARTLQFNSAGCWRNGNDGLPFETVSGSPWDHAQGRAVDALSLDNDFFGWNGNVRIVDADGFEVHIEASADFPVLRVYSPPGKDFFGVEPVSHIADAINRPALAAGGIALVPAGARLNGMVTIAAEWSA